MMGRIANGRDRLDSVPTEFRTPHTSKGSVDLSGSSRKPRVTAWLPNRLAATRNHWVPATRFRECRHAGMTELLIGFETLPPLSRSAKRRSHRRSDSRYCNGTGLRYSFC